MTASLAVVDLTCESLRDPIGIDVVEPRLSWKLDAGEGRRGVRQTAYRIQVAGSRDSLAAGDDGADLLWDSGRVSSGASLDRPYGGPEPGSRQRSWWRVRIWDEAGAATAWSEPAHWEMGLLETSDWRARWIGPGWEEETSKPQPVPMLRHTFRVPSAVAASRLYVTSLGLYEVELNGVRVGDAVFTPGWTSYEHRLQYQTYDVTDLVRQGENGIGVLLGDGWYRGFLGFRGRRNTYGEKLALLLQLEIETADGGRMLVTSGEDWKGSVGPIRFSDFYLGERYDARLEMPGWSSAGFDDRDWSPVVLVEQPQRHLVAPIAPPVRRIEEMRPLEILHTPAGETVVDLGQNLVGRVRLRVRGPAGTVVVLRHAEILDRDGNFYTANLRAAEQKVEYVGRGGGEEVYEPHFTFQGFRYVKVEGYPGELEADDITAVVLHSDLPRSGHFESSSPLLDRLQSNIVWGQRGNFLEVPTDCPQRDERLGWTGDAQVFLPTAAFNMDVSNFFRKWLRDLAADQTADGRVPFVIPNVFGPERSGAAGWSDAVVVVPLALYAQYGDRRILEEQYASMTSWLDFVEAKAQGGVLWKQGFQFGDWLEPKLDHDPSPQGTTPKELIATAYFAHATELVGRAAEVLGRDEDARRYARRAATIRDAFRREYVEAEGRLRTETQTGYVLALAFDLLTPEERPQAVRRLVADIRRRDTHLATGFLGTPHLLHVLTRFDRIDLAYELLLQESFPSWLYAVTRGATTIWERWDGVKPNGDLQDPGMNSFNHYAFGAVGDWLYRVVAGIYPLQPGYRSFAVRPRPGGDLGRASARYESRYGAIESSWRRQDGRFELDVLVPPGTEATVYLPRARRDDVRVAGAPLRQVEGLSRVQQQQREVRVELGSGRYRFSYRQR